VKAAWRHGYHGLVCIVAVAWDTQFSPVDVRTLAARHRAVVGGRLVFDRQADGRTKTGRAAIGTVSQRTERLVTEYLRICGSICTRRLFCFETDRAIPTVKTPCRMISPRCAS